MEIKILDKRISNQELRAFLGHPFPTMVKFVVDINSRLLALGGELHSDAEEFLLTRGSSQADLWGGNIYPDEAEKRKIVFESLINIRPPINRSLTVQDPAIQERMRAVVGEFIAL